MQIQQTEMCRRGQLLIIFYFRCFTKGKLPLTISYRESPIKTWANDYPIEYALTDNQNNIIFLVHIHRDA